MKRGRCVGVAALVGAACLAPAAAHAEPIASESASTTPEPSSTKLRGLAGGGASTSGLFGLSSSGAHVEGGAGIEREDLFVPIRLEADIGRTRGGLAAGQVAIGAAAQGIVGRLRLGGGAGVGYAWIGRASTSTGGHITMYALDAFALATVDLFETGERRAVYLGLEPSLGVRWGESFFAWGHGALSWRGTAMIGVRF